MGLLDSIGNALTDPAFLGALQAYGNSPGIAPQAASRLPLAQPNAANILGNMAGGYMTGQKQQAETGLLQGQAASANLTALSNLQNYNLVAPYFGQSTVTMKDLQSGNFDKPTMAKAAALTPGGGDQTAPAQPQGGGLLSGASDLLSKATGGLMGSPSMPQDGQPQPTPQPAPQPAQGAQTPAAQPPMSPPQMASGGAPASPPGLAQGSMPQAGNPVVQRRLNQLLFGADLSPLQKIIVAQGGNPYDQKYAPMLQNEAIKASGVNPVIGGDRAGVPAQAYDTATNSYKVLPGQLEAQEQGARANAFGRSQGELGAKEAERSFQAGLDVQVSNATNKLKTFYDTGIMPPDAMSPGAAQPAISAKGDIATPRGTVVPAQKQTPFLGTNAIGEMNKNTAETEKSFAQIRPSLEGTESRLVGLAKTLQQIQGKGLNEAKAEVAASLQGLGVPQSWIDSTVMSAKDMSAVQTAIGLQTLDVLGQLKQINQGTGGRILNSEFVNMLDKQYGPNMSPQANYDLLSQALGGVLQTKNMIDDYYQFGKPSGARDANGFMSSWYNQEPNGMPSMVKRAGEAMGPLKGMDKPPVDGARKAPDGNWYVSDPNRPGKYMMVK